MEKCSALLRARKMEVLQRMASTAYLLMYTMNSVKDKQNNKIFAYYSHLNKCNSMITDIELHELKQ
jgi:hypothetical protein